MKTTNKGKKIAVMASGKRIAVRARWGEVLANAIDDLASRAKVDEDEVKHLWAKSLAVVLGKLAADIKLGRDAYIWLGALLASNLSAQANHRGRRKRSRRVKQKH